MSGVSNAGLVFVIIVALVIAADASSKRNFGWFLVALATAFCAGLAIYFRLMGQI